MSDCTAHRCFAASPHKFETDHVEAGMTVVSDDRHGYSGFTKLGYRHDRRSR